MTDMPHLLDALASGGEGHRLGFFGSHALNSMRMEVGYKVSADMTNEVTAFEAGLMRFVEIDKGDFVGRDALFYNMQSPRWKLVYLGVDTGSIDADCLGGEGVFKGEKRVGVVTTAGFGFTTGSSLAWAYVDPDQSDPGNELSVLVLGRVCRASVLAEPVWGPASERPRS